MNPRTRLENLRKRLRERLKTSGVDRDILELIREIEMVTDNLLRADTTL